MVETHLGPNTDVHQTHLKQIKITDQITHTLSCLDQQLAQCDEAQPK